MEADHDRSIWEDEIAVAVRLVGTEGGVVSADEATEKLMT